jgi:hypothetical protein
VRLQAQNVLFWVIRTHALVIAAVRPGERPHPAEADTRAVSWVTNFTERARPRWQVDSKPQDPRGGPMITSKTFKHLAARTAAAAFIAASAGTAGLCLTTSADAAVVSGGSLLRMLADDELQTAAGGLRMPAVHPAARKLPGRGVNW